MLLESSTKLHSEMPLKFSHVQVLNVVTDVYSVLSVSGVQVLCHTHHCFLFLCTVAHDCDKPQANVYYHDNSHFVPLRSLCCLNLKLKFLFLSVAQGRECAVCSTAPSVCQSSVHSTGAAEKEMSRHRHQILQ